MEEDKTSDRTDTFLYNMFCKPHTISALVITLIALISMAFYYKHSNILTGLMVSSVVFLIIGLMQFSDSIFERPHPAIWRVVKAWSVLYLMLLIFLLFQDKHDVRQWLKAIDSSLGVPLPEKSYAVNCGITWDNLYNQMDIFVVAHIFGWYFKALMLRDYYVCWICSIMFEAMEYSLQHQLPNFAECWWDHWILDVFTCNALGIYLGIKTCEYLNAKMYLWRGESLKEHGFVIFEWIKGANTFKHYVGVVVLVVLIMAAELNTFYLKALLWLKPSHFLNVLRLVLYVLMGSVAIREGYSYFSDKKCKRFGSQLWTCVAIINVEMLLCFKYGIGEFPNPWPTSVLIFWVVLLSFLVLFPLYKFWYKNEKTEKVD